MKTFINSENLYGTIVISAIGILIFLLFMLSLPGCSDPMNEIVDGEKAQPEGQIMEAPADGDRDKKDETERGITL